jgi:hypothetical protein
MKNALLLIASVFLLGASCQDEQLSASKTCIPVKVLRSICGNAVFQIQDSRFYGYGESVGNEENVFLAVLECNAPDAVSLGNSEPQQEIFYAELDPENFNSNCAVCLAMVNYEGQKHYKVRLHEVCHTIDTDE